MEILNLITKLRAKAVREGCSVKDILAFCDEAESAIEKIPQPKASPAKTESEPD